MAGISCGNAIVWIVVFEGCDRDDGEGAVRFSHIWAEAISRAMQQRIQTNKGILHLQSGRPGEQTGGTSARVERRVPRHQIFRHHDCCALASS